MEFVESIDDLGQGAHDQSVVEHSEHSDRSPLSPWQKHDCAAFTNTSMARSFIHVQTVRLVWPSLSRAQGDWKRLHHLVAPGKTLELVWGGNSRLRNVCVVVHAVFGDVSSVKSVESALD